MRKTSPGLVLFVLSLAAFMASLDLFIVNVAFGDIRRDFGGASLANLSWVLNAYAIIYAAALVPLGRLADRYGNKAGFLVGLAVFTAASAACAVSNALWTLVVFRVLQALGAALLTPTSMGLLLNATPPEGRAKAVRIWAATGSLAAAAGPVVGGFLIEVSWRWVFLVNLPVGVLALIGAMRWVPSPRDDRAGRIPDLLAAALLATAIGALSLALVRLESMSWSSPEFIVSIGVAAAGLAWFWRRSVRHPAPIVEPSLLSVRSFAWANVAALTFSVGFAANLLANVLWMQEVWHYSALRTGLAIAPGPLMVPLFAMIGQIAARKTAVGRVAALGCLMCAAGAMLVSVNVGAEPAYATALLPGWMIAGAGVGLALPTILSSATAGLPAGRASTGSAIVNMARQVGSVLGVSVLVALLGHPATYEAVHAAFQHVWWAAAAGGLLAVAATLRMTPTTTTHAAPWTGGRLRALLR